MTQVQIDEVLAEKLGGFESSVELRDSQGVTGDHYLPEAKYVEMLRTALKNVLGEQEFKRREGMSGAFTVDQMRRELSCELVDGV